MAKNVDFKLSGDEFFMMSISKIMVPLSFPGFLLNVVKFAIVLVTYVKHLLEAGQAPNVSIRSRRYLGLLIVPV